MFPKNRKNKLRQTKKNDMKEEIYLNYRTVITYILSVSLFFYFSSDKLNKLIEKNVFILFSFSNLILVSLLQSWQKRTVGVYKVFNSNHLTLLFYSVYLYFILDLTRGIKKHNCPYFKL